MHISIIGVPWYRREDYAPLRRLFADGDRLHGCYEDWLNAAESFLDQLRSQGQAFRKVYIYPDEFSSWCALRGLNIDSKARIRFANEAVPRKDGNQDG